MAIIILKIGIIKKRWEFFFWGLIIVFVSPELQGQQNNSPGTFTFLREDNTVHRNAKGFWKSIGSGYILDATADSIFLYSFTSDFTYKEKNDYLEGLLNSQSRFQRIGDTLRIFLTDYGKNFSRLQISNDFIRIDKLPANTISFKQMQQLKPPQLFDLFIQTLKENYAFSKERKMNWDSLKGIYRQKISDTSASNQLFETIGEVVTLTKDHHTKIINEAGRTLQYRGTPSAVIVSKAFEQQSEIKTLTDYFNLFFQKNYQNISDSLLSGKGKKLANGQIEYGDISASIGYINIYSFSGFAQRQFTRKQQIDTIVSSMEQIIKEFKNKKAIIVDICFNFGGYDAAALCIAGFFTKNSVFAYNSQVYNNGSYYDESRVDVYPTGKEAFTKPVYVLISDISRSAAECFAMMMKSLPNVKLAGTNTMGILSGMLGKSIGEYYSTSSNQRLVDVHNKYYEVTGVIPDINMNIFRSEDIFRSHMITVKALAAKIEKDLK